MAQPRQFQLLYHAIPVLAGPLWAGLVYCVSRLFFRGIDSSELAPFYCLSCLLSVLGLLFAMRFRGWILDRSSERFGHGIWAFPLFGAAATVLGCWLFLLSAADGILGPGAWAEPIATRLAAQLLATPIIVLAGTIFAAVLYGWAVLPMSWLLQAAMCSVGTKAWPAEKVCFAERID